MSVDVQGGYQGLYFGRQPATIYDDENAVIVKHEAAREAQAKLTAATANGNGADVTAAAGATGTAGLWSGGGASTGTSGMRENGGAYTGHPAAGAPGGASSTSAATAPTSFFGSVELNALMLASGAGAVAEGIVQHLTSLLGSDVKVRLEIEAHIPGGVPEKTQRDVTENARTLKFKTAECE